VVVKVGPNKTQYTLHKELLAFHSKYFRDAFTERRIDEAERKFILQDTEPWIFDIFVDWMYGAKIPHSFEDWHSSRDDGVVVMSDHWKGKGNFVTVLSMAYCFSKQHSVKAFQTAILQTVTDCVLYPPDYQPERLHEPERLHALISTYGALPWKDDLLQFLIAFHIKYCTGWWYDHWFTEHAGKDTQGLVLKLLSTYADKVRWDPAWFKEDLVPCDYHRHATTQERETCARERRARVA
jgi:hypothetical protein